MFGSEIIGVNVMTALRFTRFPNTICVSAICFATFAIFTYDPLVLYQPYPSNWPTFPPRDKVADWLETYANTQELVAWTSSYPVGRPVYSKDTRKWTLTINHDGNEVVLHPAHIVLATGTLGAPYIPPLDGRDAFGGSVIHSATYKNEKPYVGKNVVVVGSGQSAADICEELARAGISVTMLQRSPTDVSGRNWRAVLSGYEWPTDVPVEASDFKAVSIPRGLLRNYLLTKEAMEKYHSAQADLHGPLRKAGVMLNMETPQTILWWERLGGT